MNQLTLQNGVRLDQYVQHQLAEIDRKLCNVIFKRAVHIMGYSGMRRNGPKVMGKIAYNCAIEERHLPSFKLLNQAAVRLDMTMVIFLKQEGQGIKASDFRFEVDKNMTRSQLLSFMRAVAESRKACLAAPELRSFQKEELARMRDTRAAIRWKSLIAFFAACGYEMNIWLEDNIPAWEASLLSRLNYPD
jgi:hypothetical protein